MRDDPNRALSSATPTTTAAQSASSEAAALLERILDEGAVVDWRMRTAGERILEYAADSVVGLLRIRDPSGAVCLSVTLDEAGVQLRIDARSVEVHAGEHLALVSRHIRLAAAERLELASGGSIHQVASENVISQAFEHDIEATNGEIRLTANDDIALDGERIRLNSPRSTQTRRAPQRER